MYACKNCISASIRDKEEKVDHIVHFFLGLGFQWICCSPYVIEILSNEIQFVAYLLVIYLNVEMERCLSF